MKTARFVPFAFAGLLVAAVHADPAQAATRTWVSGTGDDGFPCSRTSPCKTFAGALTKTDAGGGGAATASSRATSMTTVYARRPDGAAPWR